MGSYREKSKIAIAILTKLPFLKGKKILSHFDGSNNIFAVCNIECSYNIVDIHSIIHIILQVVYVVGENNNGSSKIRINYGTSFCVKKCGNAIFVRNGEI